MTRSSRPFETFLDRLPLTTVRTRLVGVRLAIKIGVPLCADAGGAAGGGVRTAGCRNDVGRARVLQEDGGTVRGHGDGKIPSLLSADNHVTRFSCPEGPFFFAGPRESRGSSGLPISVQGVTCLR